MRRQILKHFVLIAGVVFLTEHAGAQVNGAGDKPYLGWSSFSEQTINGSFLTQANMITQSDALKASGLQNHGFVYINLDSGWQGSFDGNGRPIPNSSTFPNIKAMVDHIHANGQKAGIYWIPGIEQPAVDGNYPILGTPYHTQDIVALPLARGNAFGGNPPNPYHDKIDFRKPGAQEYIDSVVALFLSGVLTLLSLMRLHRAPTQTISPLIIALMLKPGQRRSPRPAVPSGLRSLGNFRKITHLYGSSFPMHAALMTMLSAKAAALLLPTDHVLCCVSTTMSDGNGKQAGRWAGTIWIRST